MNTNFFIYSEDLNTIRSYTKYENFKIQRYLYACSTVWKRLLAVLVTLAEYLVVSLILITTARRSPVERFGLNVSC